MSLTTGVDPLACGVGTTAGEKSTKSNDEVDFKDVSIEEALRLLEVRHTSGRPQ